MFLSKLFYHRLYRCSRRCFSGSLPSFAPQASGAKLNDPFVTSQWLKQEMKNQNKKIKLLDCSWYMPGSHGPVIEDWKQNRLKGSSFFDIDKIADVSLLPLPHMVPTPKLFEEQVSELGISNDDHVICYDSTGLYVASARVWWLFRLFGHESVSVLEKGFVPEDFKDTPDLIETSVPSALPKGQFKSKPQYHLLIKLDQILKNIDTKEFQVIDARSASRFDAETPEPRPGLKGGHTPGAFNVPYNLLVQNRVLIPPEKIASVFTSAGVNLNKPLVTSCGSGVTAAVLSLALYKIGKVSALYDGSWAEYGQEKLHLPVEPKK